MTDLQQIQNAIGTYPEIEKLGAGEDALKAGALIHRIAKAAGRREALLQIWARLKTLKTQETNADALMAIEAMIAIVESIGKAGQR